MELGLFSIDRVRAAAPAASYAFTSSKERARLRLYAALIALDLASLTAGYLLAWVIRSGHPLQLHSLQLLGLMVPSFLGVALNNGAYSIAALERPGAGTAKAAEALMFSLVGVLLVLFYLKVSADFSRLVFAIGTFTGLGLLALSRWSFGHWVGRAHDWSFENTLVLIDEVPLIPRRGEVVIFADQASIDPDVEDPSILDKIGALIRHCERIVVACPVGRRTAWAHMLKGCAMDVELVTPELLSIGAVGLRSCGDRKTLVVSARPLGLRDRIMKRLLDLTIAGSAIIVFSPVLLVIGLVIKLDSPGPALFKQERVGLNNKMFKLLKFRSMRADRTDWIGTRSASRNDDRMTRVGRFLRQTSLDELPQLFNVLTGDMSIVGPRPHALGSTAEERLFWQIDRRYFHRHAVKPGMTGLAQVRGYRGATVREVDLTNRLQCDLEYLAGWTIWRDLKILLTTFKVVAHGNAY